MPTEYFSSYDGKKLMAKMASSIPGDAVEIVPNLLPEHEGYEECLPYIYEDNTTWDDPAVILLDIHCPTNIAESTVEIGGRSYKTVELGNNIWLAENLDYKFSGCDISTQANPISGQPTTPTAWYYNNDESQYGIDGSKKCGLLYNWAAVKYIGDNDVIPGWHVATIEDWRDLVLSLGGNNLIDFSRSDCYDEVICAQLNVANGSIDTNWPVDWNGTNIYKFNHIPAGARWVDWISHELGFYKIGVGAAVWTSSQEPENESDPSGDAYLVWADNDYLCIYEDTKLDAYSVRLVKNKD